jgi:hypothetical protein
VAAETPGGTSGVYAGSEPLAYFFRAGPAAGGQSNGENFFAGGAGNTTMTNGAGATNLASANTGIGRFNLNYLTSGRDNTALGRGALYNTTTGELNTGFGIDCLKANTTGSNNTACGADSLFRNTTGIRNTGLGVSSMVFNTTGSENTAMGTSALYNNETGVANTCGGYGSLFSQTGNESTALGYLAGRDHASSRGLFLGAYAGRYETGGDCLYIDVRDRSNTAGDKALALLYGTFAATAAGQTLRINGVLTIGAVTEYADNAAALTGGLAVGAVYRTGDALKIVR